MTDVNKIIQYDYDIIKVNNLEEASHHMMGCYSSIGTKKAYLINDMNYLNHEDIDVDNKCIAFITIDKKYYIEDYDDYQFDLDIMLINMIDTDDNHCYNIVEHKFLKQEEMVDTPIVDYIIDYKVGKMRYDFDELLNLLEEKRYVKETFDFGEVINNFWSTDYER